MNESNGLNTLKNVLSLVSADLCIRESYYSKLATFNITLEMAYAVSSFLSSIKRVSVRKLAYDYLDTERLHWVKLSLMILHDKNIQDRQSENIKILTKLAAFNESVLPHIVHKYSHAIRVYGEYSFDDDIHHFSDSMSETDLSIFKEFNYAYQSIGDTYEDYVIATDIENVPEAKLAYFFMNTYAYLKDTKRLT